MRRTITILAALGLVFAGSCQRIEEGLVQEGPDVIEGEILTVEASFGDFPDTKTAVQSDGKSIFWTPGDAINLFFGDISSAKFTTSSSMTEPSATASFTGTLGAATGSSGDGFVAPTFWGVYPYDAANTCNGTSVTLKIKSEQTAGPGTFGNGMSPSVANAPGLGLSFKNVGSWFKFSVSQEGITAATFEGNNGEILAGKVTVTMDSDGNPLITNVADGATRITVKPEGGGSFVPNQYYYITLIPQTISGATGYTLTLYKGGQEGRLVVADPSKTYTFARSNSRSKTNADAGLTWEDVVRKYVDMGEGHYWADRNIGANSPEEYGDYFAWGETAPKSNYSWSTYAWGSSRTSLTKYVTSSSYGTVDNRLILSPEDDAAQNEWGGNWFVPTQEEWAWLYENTNIGLEEIDGQYAIKLTSKINGNSIILPMGGFMADGGVISKGTDAYYYSSSLDNSDNEYAKDFYLGMREEEGVLRMLRTRGLPVRPVYRLIISGHEYVEMGEGYNLKWATCNVGASAPEDNGDYFAWGETTTKSNYSWSTYFDNPSGDGKTFTKYAADKTTVLDPADDAARQNWGSTWRIPTDPEWEALLNTTNFDWDWDDVRKGYKVTSKVSGYVGNSIFLPAAGGWNGTSFYDAGSHGFYWSSSLDELNSFYVWYVDFYSGGVYRSDYYRFYGYSVRPVSE